MGSKSRTHGGYPFALFLSLSCAVAAARDARAAEGAPEDAPFRVKGLRGDAAWAVKRVLIAVDALLADATCQEVLTDFHDASGRTLKDVFEGYDVSVRTYFRWISFSDGRDTKACRTTTTLAATERGSRVVFVCPTAFVEATMARPEEAQATLIYEMLHSLGLGENPLSSREITARVQARCTSATARSAAR